jgi:cytidylate kinase
VIFPHRWTFPHVTFASSEERVARRWTERSDQTCSTHNVSSADVDEKDAGEEKRMLIDDFRFVV